MCARACVRVLPCSLWSVLSGSEEREREREKKKAAIERVTARVTACYIDTSASTRYLCLLALRVHMHLHT